MNILDILERGIKYTRAKIRLKLPTFLRRIACLPMRVAQQANGLCTYCTSSDRLLDFFPFNSVLASLKLANNLNLCYGANVLADGSNKQQKQETFQWL